MQPVRPAVVADRRERVVLEQVVDRDRALVLDVGAGAADRALVERDLDEALLARRPPRRSSPVEPDRHRARVRAEPLGLAERDRGRPERGELVGAAPQDRGALHEVEHAEPGGEARRARGRQHVVGARRRSRRSPPAYGRRGRSRRCCGCAPRARRRRARRSRDARARPRRPAAPPASSVSTRMTAPKSRHEAPAMSARGSVVSCAATAASTSRASAASSVIRIDCAAVSCSACASRSAAIHSGIGVAVGEDQHLGRPGDHVDADLAEHQRAWPPPRRRCRGRRSCRPGRCSPCRRRAPPPPARRRRGRSRRRRRAARRRAPAG